MELGGAHLPILCRDSLELLFFAVKSRRATFGLAWRPRFSRTLGILHAAKWPFHTIILRGASSPYTPLALLLRTLGAKILWSDYKKFQLDVTVGYTWSDADQCQPERFLYAHPEA
ncbi:hypothetical protein CEXT_683741 [Caerostris extrusa]|uniref:Uncharacterized protein n=1 Tax=Caerostris extrusa TaxID=172846 RepID=A0AAV4M6M9_CAEEX|nr:hypothetical protein CEXT_683741 [Caerostris extrusa]